MKKILAIANSAALILTILINYISNAGMLNGNTMKTISDKYFNYLPRLVMPFPYGGLQQLPYRISMQMGALVLCILAMLWQQFY